MEQRAYRLGRRQAAADRTRAAILAAARDLLASGEPSMSAGAVARRASVSRITVYNQFGSKAGLLRELAAAARQTWTDPAAIAQADPQDQLRARLAASCSRWAADPALFRALPPAAMVGFEAPAADRALADSLSAAGRLRPGCSLKEAEDVIGALASFPVFDRLYKDGRRSTAAVTDVLMRLASAILA